MQAFILSGQNKQSIYAVYLDAAVFEDFLESQHQLPLPGIPNACLRHKKALDAFSMSVMENIDVINDIRAEYTPADSARHFTDSGTARTLFGKVTLLKSLDRIQPIFYCKTSPAHPLPCPSRGNSDFF